MKYKYTGTEEQLIEAGFRKNNKVISTIQFIRNNSDKTVTTIYRDIPIINVWDGEDKNRTNEIWIENIKNIYGTCDNKFVKEYIQDLIEKGLVEVGDDRLDN